jgi:hypothetical protein
MTFSIQQHVSLRQLGLLIPTERGFWLGWVVEIVLLKLVGMGEMEPPNLRSASSRG